MIAEINKDYDVINKNQIRKGVPEKATGRAKYTADLSFPQMLTGAILFSPLAHARILSIDTSEAEKLPGVKAVITGKDKYGMRLFGASPARTDETALAVDKVRHYGDEVAAVAAVDEQTAKEALELIKVEYEELPILLNPLAALEDGAPLIHGKIHHNICAEVHNHFGNVPDALDKSYVVRTDRFMNKKTDGTPMEPQSCVGTYDLSGNLTLWTSTQVSHYVQRDLSMVLNIPIGKVRVVAPSVGGGFGQKSTTGSHEIITALLAIKTGLPVKLVLDREQVFWHSRARHQYYHEMRMGINRDGIILGHEHLSVLEGGAYTGLGIATVYYNGSLLSAPYRIKNIKYDGYRVYTNKPASSSLRGHGGVSNRALFELQLDMIAKELGIDPVEIRIKNAYHAGETTAHGYYVSSFDASGCLEAAREDSRWAEKKGKMPYGKGIGVASSYFVTGAGAIIYRTDIPHSAVMLKVSDDGRMVTAFTGSNEIGQGSDTVVAMITAEILGLKVEDINVISGDTQLCPVDVGAYSSRQTLMTGNATKEAAESLRDQILQEASKDFGVPVEELKMKNGKIYGTERNDDKLAEVRHKYKADHRGFTGLPKEGPITFEEYNRVLYAKKGTLMSKGIYKPGKLQSSTKWKGAVVGSSPAYSTQSCIAEVSVDLDTGVLSIDKLTLAHDCGFAINRQSVEGQMDGSMCHGLSEALFEEVVFDDKGRVVNSTLGDYKIATSLDIPELSSLIIESNEPKGPFGAKEVGEGCILPVIPAILNAVYDACGVVIMELPISSEKILKGIKTKKEKGTDTYICQPTELANKIINRADEMRKKSGY